MDRLWPLATENPFFDELGVPLRDVPLVLARAHLLLARRAARRVPARAIAALAGEAEGSRLRVRGRVRATWLLAGPERAVWRRVEARVRVLVGSLFHTRTHRFYRDLAEDFELVDDRGDSVLVDVTSARLLARPTGGFTTEPDRVEQALAWVPAPLRGRRPSLRVRECVVRDGEIVEVVGCVARGASGRPLLAAGVDQPLAVVPA